MNIDEDCSVITDIPLSDEVVDFIEKGLRRDLTDKDVIEWCDDNLDDLASIYEKYRGMNLSYRMAEMTMFFVQSVYGRDDAIDIISAFVDCN